MKFRVVLDCGLGRERLLGSLELSFPPQYDGSILIETSRRFFWLHVNSVDPVAVLPNVENASGYDGEIFARAAEEDNKEIIIELREAGWGQVDEDEC